MKLWDAMRLLEENTTDVYEAQMNEDWKVRMTVKTGFFVGYYNFEVFKGKRLIDQSRGGGFNNNVALDLDWQLVNCQEDIRKTRKISESWNVPSVAEGYR